MGVKDEVKKLQQLEKLEWELVREAALQSTWFMATRVLWPDVAQRHYWEPLHKPLCDWEDSTPKGGRRGVVIARAHRKTMLMTVAHAVRRITRDPNIRYLCVTALDRSAIKLAQLVTRQFQENKSYRNYFPEMALKIDAKVGTQYGFVHPARTSVGLLDDTFTATYLGAPFIGRRADIIDCDDPIDEDMVGSPDMASKTNGKMNELIPLLDKSGDYDMLIVKGTPKSYNDYYALMDGLMAISDDGGVERPTQVFEVKRRAILEDSEGKPSLDGEPILPNVYTRESALQILDQCKLDPDRGESYFWREYMCQVMAPADQKFLPEWFDTWVEVMPSNIVFSGIAMDSALKDEQILFRGDRSVVLVGHFDVHGHLYLTDGAMSRSWRSSDASRMLISMAQNPINRGVSNFLKEKVGEGAFFGQVRAAFTESRLPLTVFPLKLAGAGKKYLRITDSLQGPTMARKVHFVKGFPKDVHKALVDEAVHLGMWSHDDVVDALSLFYHPEIRVQPSTRLKTDWKVPISRPVQISTSRSNTAAVSAVLAQQALRSIPATPKVLRSTRDVMLHQDGKIGTFDVEGLDRPSPAPFNTEDPWWLKP